MSEITIHKHLDYAIGKFKDLINSHDLFSTMEQGTYITRDMHSIIMGELLSMQHILFKKHLAEKYFNELKWDTSKMEPKELLNRWYTFLYDTTIKAGYDEFFEVEDAFNGYIRVMSDIYKDSEMENFSGPGIARLCENEKRKNKLKYLSVEEIIDVFHFFLQLITIEEEHKLASYLEFDTNNFKDIIVSPNNKTFLEDTLDILKLKATHVSFPRGGKYKYPYFIGDFILDFNRINRNFMRLITWKPWKTYKEDHYNTLLFGDMTSQTRLMYTYLADMFVHIMAQIPDLSIIEDKELVDHLDIDNPHLYDQIKNNVYVKTLVMLYIIYMSKNYENIKRQENGY